MKQNLENYCINNNSSIREAMKVIDKALIGAALVIDEDKVLKGIITDGDIRRALLADHNLNEKIMGIYNTNFKFADEKVGKIKLKEIMLKYKIRQIPILNEDKKLIDLYFIDDLISYSEKDNYVFILAGGLGTRLRPLTNNVPKPMLKVGEKPILERIIEQFREFGYSKFIISLNYLGNIIEDYFDNGEKFDVSIEYVKETKQLGTAGSIRLIKDKITKPFIVINGDILTGLNFDAFLEHHNKNKFDITVGVRNYEFKVPYGVMNTEGMKITSLEEKPIYNFYINSGIYSVNPEIINFIPQDEFFNMTDLIDYTIKEGYKSGIYHIAEYWTDIGQIEDYRKANEDFNKFF